MFKNDSTNAGRGRAVVSRLRGLFLSAAITLTLVACKEKTDLTQASVTQPSPVAAVGDANAAVAQNSYADVVDRVAPAVVTIRSSRRVREAQQFPFMDDPRFREFFGDRMPRQQQQPPQRESGLGSGVIVNADGYILTNHHVVDGAEEIKVELRDNRTLPAKLVGSDPPSDLAVLKIEAHNLPVLALGDSDRVRVGDAVLAIGNPLGIGQTVTSGIISAKGRSTGLSDGSFEDFLQTDAAINRGNSGGALVNTAGELIGINSQILSPSGGNIGIGFAIPANMAKSVMEQLIKTGKVRRGMLGVQIQQVTSDLAASLGLQQARGALVNSVQAGGPAERAGVKRGDVITAVNGTAIADSNALRNTVARTAPGTEVALTVLRDGREQQLRVTLGELPERQTERGATPEGGGDQNSAEGGRLGLSLEPLTADVARELGLPSGTQGLVVRDVDPSGPAAEAGIRRGDVVEEVNRQSVRSVADLRAALQRSGDRPVLLLINREGNEVFLPVRPRQ